MLRPLETLSALPARPPALSGVIRFRPGTPGTPLPLPVRCYFASGGRTAFGYSFVPEFSLCLFRLTETDFAQPTMLQNKSRDPIEKVSISIVNLSGTHPVRYGPWLWLGSVRRSCSIRLPRARHGDHAKNSSRAFWKECANDFTLELIGGS